ncbi:MAG: phosphatase PAP2 family protein [Labilithrix sp.]
MPRLLVVVAGVVSGLSMANNAGAEPLSWNEAWPKFRPAEIAFSAGETLQVAASVTIWNQPTRNFDGPVLFDKPARQLLRLHDRDARTAAATVSDMMYYSLLVLPAIEAPVVAGIRGESTVAIQTLAINWESFAFTGATAIALEKVGRARPMARECDRDPGYDRRCDETARLNTSNVSGHTAIAFTGAALTCAHHVHLPLYGGGAPDTMTCVAAMSVAAAQGMLRIHSDNHYATDVVLGAALGIGSGYLLPRLLHYRGPSGRAATLLPTFRSRELGATAVLAPSVAPTSIGVTLGGAL